MYLRTEKNVLLSYTFFSEFLEFQVREMHEALVFQGNRHTSYCLKEKANYCECMKELKLESCLEAGSSGHQLSAL